MSQTGYTSGEVAALSGLSQPHVRALARAGVVGGKGGAERLSKSPWRFSFRDVRVLRSAAKLMGQQVGHVHMQRTLKALKAQVAERALPLSGAHLVQQAGRIFARDGQSMWDTESGQTMLWYEPQYATTTVLPQVAPSGATVALPRALPNDGGQKGADEHFIAALTHEASDPEVAYQSYLSALACDPTHVEANINIGRICCAFGDYARAVGYFTVATLLDPAHSTAQFNLAVSLHDAGRFAEAEVAYRHALVLNPDNQDALVNLKLLLSDDSLA